MTARLAVHAVLTGAALAILLGPPLSGTEVVLVGRNTTWRYLDNGSNQGTAWRAVAFNDTAWKTGAAELGYGDGDEATVVGFGPSSSAKYITTYFRKAFTVADPAVYQSLVLNILRDDGAVVYLNGAEVFRTNMPTGTITYTTPATTAVGGADETRYYTTAIAPGSLAAGTNVIAVEIHQSSGTSSDVSFNLELLASDALTLTRGPYLQLGTPNSMIVRWRTSGASDSQVRYGPDPANLIWSASSALQTTEHVVPLTSLTPDTKYYYAVGSTTATLAGGDSTHAFTTSPTVGSSKPTRVWVLGDSGTADANARAVRDAYYAFTGSRATDLWLMLGDNAYESGTDAEFQSAVFDMYPATLRQSVLWPTLGNHDGVAADSSTQTGAYYDIFSLPASGQAGGLASGTEAYYSFDYGDIHFVCLESFETNRLAAGPMMTWLQNDLASTSQRWVVAFWHHPPYSKGSHDSDTDATLREMRENALPILEAAGVDLVLAGHSHSYERSFLLDGHYGSSTTLTAAMKKNAGSGRETETGAYTKPTPGMASHEGAVYTVAGSSGKVSGGPLNHPAMFISMSVLGSMVLDINGNRLDARFLDNTGATRDSFTILKGVAPPAPPSAPDGLTASATSSTQISLAWTDTSSNETGFRIERASGGGAFAEIGTVAANQTSYASGGLSASTAYSYRVRAYNGAGNSGYSNVASATTLPPAPAPVRINFQPSSAPVPSGYLSDGGAAYGNRGNGRSYGWNASNTAHARDRNSSRSPDQRYDTLNHMQKGGSFRWEIGVANGTYQVRVVAGDAGHFDSTFRITVEGVLTVSGTPTSATRWIEGTRTVAVTDGRLTVANGSGASNNKICFVDITPQ